MDSSIERQASSLISQIASQCSSGQHFGSFSSSVYDTAWVSMLRKPDEDSWLFPQCFEYVLKHQLASGAWESYATAADGILNTAAGLLALMAHRRDMPNEEDWSVRSKKAQESLECMLINWDVSSTDQVGFELLVVKHLSLLREKGVYVDFPQLNALQEIHNSKLAQLPLEDMYQSPSTLYHSLEAFIGHIDFDRVGRWRERNGSMMGSPASTAAYLAGISGWDEEAESYLNAVIRRSTGGRDGGVPCAWPTSVFEVSWIITTLAHAGISIDEAHGSSISRFLEESLEVQNGVTGFFPFALPDADDTAKAYMALHCLGRPVAVHPIIENFESERHFITYRGERNPSFSANTNVLTCLLMLDDPRPHISQIIKTAHFLCRQLITHRVKDKWHQNDLYWMMLLLQAFGLLYKRASEEPLKQSDSSIAGLLQDQVPPVALHLLTRILNSQAEDGSWFHGCEVTAYAVLALRAIAQFPWDRLLDNDILLSSIRRGQSFLEARRTQWAQGQYHWVEKVTYSSGILSEAYCLAASYSGLHQSPKIGNQGNLIYPIAAFESMQKAGKTITKTPLLSQMDPAVLYAAQLEACLAVTNLRRQRLDVFPRTGMAEDKYLTFIPLTWTTCNALNGKYVNIDVIQEMTTLSMLTFQADEFLETAVGRDFSGDLTMVRGLVDLLIERKGDLAVGVSIEQTLSSIQLQMESLQVPLGRFIKHVLRHPAVIRSASNVQDLLSFELKNYLSAQITQAADCRRFKLKGTSSPDAVPTDKQNTVDAASSHVRCYQSGQTFYRWVRTTSADHTSCPFAFVFYNCLITRPSEQGLFGTAKTAYVAEDLCRHLATLCRLYNDYGSTNRDRDEWNLNSINFPEFHLRRRGNSGRSQRQSDLGINTETRQEEAKADLMWIAEYERRALNASLTQLEEQAGSRELTDAIKLFINVTDLYGQIYVQKDIASRMC